VSYSVTTKEGEKMLDKIMKGADASIDIGIKLISLSIVLQIIFGSKVAFLTGNVIGSILDIVWTLGNAGLAGIIAAGIIWKLLDKDITKELKE
jgi:ABC-type dipeptide/oligopeptide/nickel transport system permease subunit